MKEKEYTIQFYPPVLETIPRPMEIQDYIYFTIYDDIGYFLIPSHYIQKYSRLNDYLWKQENKYIDQLLNIHNSFIKEIYSSSRDNFNSMIYILCRWTRKDYLDKKKNQKMEPNEILIFLNEHVDCIENIIYVQYNETNKIVQIQMPIRISNEPIIKEKKSIMKINKAFQSTFQSFESYSILFLLCILSEKRIYNFDNVYVYIDMDNPKYKEISKLLCYMNFNEYSIEILNKINKEVFTKEVLEFKRTNTFTGDLVNQKTFQINFYQQQKYILEYLKAKRKYTLDVYLSNRVFSMEKYKDLQITRLLLNNDNELICNYNQSYYNPIYGDGIYLIYKDEDMTKIIENLFYQTNHKLYTSYIIMKKNILFQYQLSIASQKIIETVLKKEQLECVTSRILNNITNKWQCDWKTITNDEIVIPAEYRDENIFYIQSIPKEYIEQIDYKISIYINTEHISKEKFLERNQINS